MDPDVTLENLRDALRKFRTLWTYVDQLDAAENLADAAEALDNWISRGGVLPYAWKR